MTVVSDQQPDLGYDTVNVYRTGSAVKIELNRPDRMNAWSSALSADLLSALRAVAADDGVRAVMLTGAGRAFCSGADLKEGMANAAANGGRLDTETPLVTWYHPIVTAIREMEKPVVTAVNGPAAGAGLSLALAGDLVVAKESAYFSLAFVNIGLVPDGGSSLFVPSRVGFARAAELAMLGERLGARTALDWGLINRVWPDEEYQAQALALLDRMAAGATRSYAGTKRQLNKWLYEHMDAQLQFGAGIQREMAASGDFAEGLAAFAEKRPPRFSGA